MRLKRSGDTIIWDIIGNNIDAVEFDINLKYLKKLKNFKSIYINIAHLENINNSTLNKFYKLHAFLQDRHVCIINVNATQNAILNLFKVDKIFQLYMSKQDAIEGKRPIINRKFKLVS